jgi:hypothetical protein
MPTCLTVVPAYLFTVPGTAAIPIRVLQGDEIPLTFRAPFPLLGSATTAMVIKASADASDAAGISLPGVITDPAGGVFEVQLTAAVTGAPSRWHLGRRLAGR